MLNYSIFGCAFLIKQQNKTTNSRTLHIYVYKRIGHMIREWHWTGTDPW